MNYTLKRNGKFFFILLFLLFHSCNLGEPVEKDKFFEKKTSKDRILTEINDSSEDIQKRIQREIFNISEKDIKTIGGIYGEEKIKELGFRTSLQKQAGWDYSIEKKNKNRKDYLNLFNNDKNHKIDKGEVGEVIKIYLDSFIKNYIPNSKVEEFNIYIDGKEFFPKNLGEKDIPKLKEILNMK